MAYDKSAVRKILDQAKAAGRAALTAPEAKGICEAYGIAVPSEAVAGTATDAAKLATRIGYRSASRAPRLRSRLSPRSSTTRVATMLRRASTACRYNRCCRAARR